MKKMKISAALLFLFLCAAAVADKKIVSPDTVDFKSILTTAPAIDSDQTKKEIEEMLVIQERRTPDEIKGAKSEETITPFIYSGVLGSWFNPDDLPKTAKLLKEVTVETTSVSGAAKDFYGRKRPPFVDARIKPCVALENTASYPSGHSTRATVWALILSDMFPDKKDALVARANQIGDDRVLGGMHFPSDVEAGRILGRAIAKKFLDDPDFKAQLQEAKDEIMADANRK